jgi:hypothetical protein
VSAVLILSDGATPVTRSGRLARHGMPRLFQTKLINIRADPSYPCRSVFYSGFRGEARLRGLARAVAVMEIENLIR